tara:strand:+ start:25145 stop:26761 length:1617 start_codon:yes stop_codon:yes gene_type:complete
MKYFNIKRNKFSTVLKDINFKKHNINKLSKYFKLDLGRYTNLQRYKFDRIYKLFIFRKNNLRQLLKFLQFKNLKKFTYYTLASLMLIVICYLNVPIFFNYEKNDIESKICKTSEIKCSIKGNISYNFLPSPRLQFDSFLIKDSKTNRVIGEFQNLQTTISIFNLLNKNKIKLEKIKLKEYQINLDLNNLKKYEKFISDRILVKRISSGKGVLNIFNNKSVIASIKNIKLKYSSNNKNSKLKLKGNIIGDEIILTLDNKNKKKLLKIKLTNLGLLTKINIDKDNTKEGIENGNFLFKKNEKRFTAIFDYKDSQIDIKKSNIRSNFFDGKLNGKIIFLPYFNFDLNFDINSINFSKVHKFLANLSDEDKKNLFKVNNKINGIVRISVEKIFSGREIVKSLESEIEFINGDILINKALFNLGKLGAADLTGIVQNQDKVSSLKFEKNIYIDNLKRFYNKFGIYYKPKIPHNLFISGNFNLEKLFLRLNEISDDNKYNEDSLAYFEREFNDILLENGYSSLFNFMKLKEFMQSITPEENQTN